MPRDQETSRYHRVALAQFSFNPAFVDTSGTSDIHEPLFPDGSFHGLHRIADIPEVAAARSRIAQAYLRHISEKIKAIAEFAASRAAEILVLPEYSVPPEVLSTCRDLACRLRLVIVAGSHTVTQTAVEQYRRIGMSGSAGRTLGRAACPVFRPDGQCTVFEKITRSKWESDMVPGNPVAPMPLDLNGDRVKLQVLICLDAIHDPAPGPKRQFRDTTPTLLAIPALSPEVGLFAKKATLVLASGRAVIFSNAAEYGGSRLYARAERCVGWLVAPDGSEPLPKSAEAIVIADLDLTQQYEIRQSTNEAFPVREIRVYPLVYADHSSLCKRYAEFQKLVQLHEHPDTEELKKAGREFVTADPRDFPVLIRDKLGHLLDRVDPAGLADDSAWRTWVDAVVLTSIESTTALRARLCSSVMNVLTQTSLLDRNPSRVVDLTEEYSHLAKRYAGIMSTMPSSLPAPISTSDAPTSSDASPTFEPPFFDRETPLDVMRRSIEASVTTCQVIAGMRGIGKTSLARELLKKVILPTWKRVWIQITEGMSFARLLSELAYRLGLKVPEELPTDDVSRADVAQDVLLYLFQTARICIVLDDFQYLVGPDRVFWNPGRVTSCLA